MNKKYTLMFFSTDRLGAVHSLTFTRTFIMALGFVLLLLLALLGFSVHKMASQKSEIAELQQFNEENHTLKNQMTVYTKQIEDITAKITAIDDFEFKIRDLIASQDGYTPLKPVAVGGREVDLLREYSAAAAMNEKEFFSTLDETLEALSSEVDRRELTLSELAADIESQRLVLLSTPTVWPVDGWVSSPFGYRLSPFTNRQTFHEGVDIAARLGTSVRATAAGTVIFAGQKPGYGYLVTIDHGHGYTTKYGHNSSLNVKVGDRVSKNDIIAKVGDSGKATGVHLHYEVLANGIPINPLKFIIDEQVL